MAIEDPTATVLAGLVALHFVEGAVLVFAGYKLLEMRRPGWAVGFSLGYVLVAVAASLYLGPVVFTLSLAEAKMVTAVSVVGAVLGMAFLVLGFKPSYGPPPALEDPLEELDLEEET